MSFINLRLSRKSLLGLFSQFGRCVVLTSYTNVRVDSLPLGQLTGGLYLIHYNMHTFHGRHRGSESECYRQLSQTHQIRLTIVNRVSSSSLGLFRFSSSSRPDSITPVSLEPRSPISETGAASSRTLSKMSFNSRLYFCRSSTRRGKNTSAGK